MARKARQRGAYDSSRRGTRVTFAADGEMCYGTICIESVWGALVLSSDQQAMWEVPVGDLHVTERQVASGRA